MNIVAITGRLVADPEMRSTTTGLAVCQFTLAVNRDYTSKDGNREADFIDCVAWRGSAEFLCKYFKKGQKAEVTGRLQTRMYEDKHGNKRKATEILVTQLGFGESKGNGNGNASSIKVSDEKPFANSSFEEIGEDEELPF